MGNPGNQTRSAPILLISVVSSCRDAIRRFVHPCKLSPNLHAITRYECMHCASIQTNRRSVICTAIDAYILARVCAHEGPSLLEKACFLLL